MKLTIIDTDKTIVYDVEWVELNTPVGNMVIQEKHVPIIIELSPEQNITFQLLSNEQKKCMITQGVAHVTRREVKILVPIKT